MATSYQTWVEEGQNYRKGCQLLRALGGNADKHMRYYDEWPLPTSIREELRMALYQMRHIKAIPTTSVPIGAGMVYGPTSGEPPEIAALRERARGLHKRHAATHADMRNATDAATRYQHAAAIMQELIPALDDIYEAIRRWELTGALPAIQQHTTTLRSDMTALQSIRSRISRLKGLIEKGGTVAEVSNWKKELQSKCQERDALQQKVTK